MMVRQYWTYLFVAAILMAACSGVEDELEGVDLQQGSDQGQPIGFGAYLQRGTTRAGATGTLTTTGEGEGEASLQEEGFGVIGYYTDKVMFSSLAMPNFMYNQQVTYDGVNSVWIYDPVKYWPNASTGGYVSFFAYAPYAAVTPATGWVTGDAAKGIAALTPTEATGDPSVCYYVSLTPSECVDLCWANPQMNLLKPAVDSRVDFNFQHALASLNVQIKADVDGGGSLDSKTRIWVRQVTFEGFDRSGQLNLASVTTPVWYDALGGMTLGTKPVTVYDGRTDGREGALASSIEQPLGLNPQLVQSAIYTTSPSLTTTTTGVTGSMQNLFNDELSATSSVMVIPTGAPMTVTIVYDIETYDPLLASNYLSDGRTNGRTIENTITATVTTDGSTPMVMQAGKRYTVNLMLGLTSVKTTASVGAWGGSTNGIGTLPDNPSDYVDGGLNGFDDPIDDEWH